VRLEPNNSAQVVVVGAGPAGSATALLLARQGIDVLVLDRHRFPRAKPCGDCLSAGAADVLHRLGVLDRVQALPGAKLRGWRITAPDGSSFAAAFGATDSGAGRHALAIERARLDAELLAAAIAAGARFEPGERVVDLIRERGRVRGVLLARRAISAQLVIGADGLRSIVAARLGAVRRAPALRKLSITFHLATLGSAPDDAAFGEMHAGDGICAGLAPVTADCLAWNLSLVVDARRFGRSVAADAHAFAAAAVRSLPRLRGRIPTALLADAPFLASGPFDRPVRSTVFDGAALVGDAAGYYDPFTGQGVFQALASAELLAATVAGALARGDTLSARTLRPYAKARARMLRGPAFVQRGIELVLARPALANAAIAHVGRADAFARALLAVTGDIAPTRALFSFGALSSLIRPAPRQEATP
jgi:menaquinone-9 beta-reductase